MGAEQKLEPGAGPEGLVQLTFLPARPPVPKADWEVLDTRQRGATFLALPVKSVLNTPASTGMGFWSINPYVGCEFGCTYCYARDTHRWVEERAVGRKGGRAVGSLPPDEAFEKRILVKTGVAEALARTLDPSRLAGSTLVIGTATDPYQPAERRFRLTRQVLEVLRRHRGLSIGLITKSPLVTRDLDLLQALSSRHDVTVNISLATVDPALARRLELRSPIPAARLRALRRLTAAGIHAGLLVAPIVPGVTDDRDGLSRLMAAGKEAGARYVVGSALRLGPAARHRFLPFLIQQFPDLALRYQRHYAHRESVSPAYQRALSHRLRELQRIHGFPLDSEMPGERSRDRNPASPAIQEPVLL